MQFLWISKKQFLSDDNDPPAITDPDIVKSLVFTSSSYTDENAKVCKELEAYNQVLRRLG